MNWTAAAGRAGRRGNRGQILPLAALLLTCMLGAAALAVDVGYLRFQQRIEQNAADSAAIAGAMELNYAGSSFRLAAQADSALNGFTTGANGVTVTVNNPPLTGPSTSNAQAVEVIVSASRATFFENVFHMSLATVRSRAVAVGGSGAINCFYVLGTSAPNINQSTITSPVCGIVVNGTLAGNSSTINMPQVGYGVSNTATGLTTPNAAPAKVAAAADPCPTIAGCAYFAANAPSTSPCAYCNFNQTGGTLHPGVYGGGDNLSGTFTLTAGVYVITSDINLSNSTLSGTGVTFYIASGGLNITGANTQNLFPPASGNGAGMLIYQPPSNSSQLLLGTKMGNSSSASIIYAPAAEMTENNATLTGIDLIINASNSFASTTFNFPAGLAVPGASGVALSE
jgi:hypothetical protein